MNSERTYTHKLINLQKNNRNSSPTLFSSQRNILSITDEGYELVLVRVCTGCRAQREDLLSQDFIVSKFSKRYMKSYSVRHKPLPTG